MKIKFEDPREEYSRQCPYCLEFITVSHLNRDYCPKKNGIVDFCKNRYKRLKEKLQSTGVVIQKPDRSPIKIDIGDPKLKRSESIDETIRMSLLNRNQTILQSLMEGNDKIEIPKDSIAQLGYSFEVYDAKLENEANLNLFKIGKFALLPIDDNHFFITYVKKLDL